MYPHLKPSQEDIEQYYSQLKESKKALALKKEMAFQPDEEGYYNCYCYKCRFFSLHDLKRHLTTHKQSRKKK